MIDRTDHEIGNVPLLFIDIYLNIDINYKVMFAFCATSRSSCLASANAAPTYIERLGVRKHTVYRAEKRRKLNELRVVGSPDIVGYLYKLASKPVLLRRPVYRTIF